MKGDGEVALILNIYLKATWKKVLEHINCLKLLGVKITTNSLRLSVRETDQVQYTLISLFNNHNERMMSLADRDYANGTYKKHVSTLGKAKKFILDRCKKKTLQIQT